MNDGDFCSDYNPDIEAPKLESNAPAIVALFLAALIICAVFAIDHWLEPPRVTFAAPTIQILVPQADITGWGPLNKGWKGDCLAVNPQRKLVMPNFHSTECTEAKVRERNAPKN